MQKAKVVPYIVTSSISRFGELKSVNKLNPTGRYKFVSNHNYSDKMFIEHKLLHILKVWVTEDKIVFLQDKSEEIFDCNNTE